ncbi:MAG: winged helix-turn-helix domain-containing protein [Burkholderiales bacterium]
MRHKPQSTAKAYSIGPFRLDPASHVVTRLGVPEPLGPRAVAVLAAIVRRAPEPILKETIIDEAWPGLVVEDNNLTVQIAAIRRTLAQIPGGDRWVETVARRGYRFVGPVTALRPGALDAQALGNVPLALTSFVGRERELVEIKSLLAKNRLLTLVGPGGIGKTRLAIQLGGEVRDAYPDGIWFADFVPLADPELVPNAVAQALNLQQGSAKSATEAIARHCKGRRLLLIFDNCEHVLDASARLSDGILRFAPEPTVIATSREPLRTEGEQVYRLSSLSLPEPASALESMRRSEAVQLFVDRAQHRQPDFVLTAHRAPIVAELCRRLDGIPLALELAAARLDSLSLEDINARLDDRFRLLTEGLRTADSRHRTLHTTLDWSYELLTEQQRKVLRRLGVFAGGFDLEAVSAIASDGPSDDLDPVELLSQLVERSLVLPQTATARHRLLETTREYALEKLATSGETDATKRRHAEYFRQLFQSAFADWFRLPDAEWQALYLRDLDNVRHALDWALRAGGDAATGISLAASSRPLWRWLGLHEEGTQWLEVALSRVDSRTPASDQARLQLSLGVLLERLAPAKSVVSLELAIDTYRSLGDTTLLGFALAFAARALAKVGRAEDSSLAIAEAARLAEHSGPPKLRGIVFGVSAWLKTTAGDLAGARTDVERALALCIETGTEYAEPATLLGDLTWAMGDLDAAASAFREVVAMMRRSTISRRTPLGYALANLAGVLAERGEVDEAMATAQESLALLAGAGGFAWTFMDHFGLCAALARKFSNAARLAGFADSANLSRGTARQPNEARARARLQTLLRAELATDELEQLLADGAKMSEDEACRLVLDS